MPDVDPWLLPEGVEEVLPPQARQIETLRRRVVDTFDSWGYQLVMTPMVEYLESLLTGTGSGLDVQTFKLIDQLNGRSMGVRADMTPQVARMDAHRLRETEEPRRLCYLGTVLHARPEGLNRTRMPIQVGAELFGHPHCEGDAEVVCLMLETLSLAHAGDVHLDLGHVGIFRSLAAQAQFDPRAERACFLALQRKAVGELANIVDQYSRSEHASRMILALPELHGLHDVLASARDILAPAGDAVSEALDTLEQLARMVRVRKPQVVLHFDLAELRGIDYHTGVVFAAFVPGVGEEVARGGRYDAIGEVFGNARAATGFSTDLRALVNLGGAAAAGDSVEPIVAPWNDDPALLAFVDGLRAEGKQVAYAVPGENRQASQGSSAIELHDGNWRVVTR